MTQQDAVRLIRKLIFAKYSQDPTHFCRCVDEIAQTLDEQGDKHSRSVAPLSATSLRSSSTTRISRCGMQKTTIRQCEFDTF